VNGRNEPGTDSCTAAKTSPLPLPPARDADVAFPSRYQRERPRRLAMDRSESVEARMKKLLLTVVFTPMLVSLAEA